MMYQLVGYYKLSKKALAKEGQRWCKFTEVSPAENTRVVVLSDGGSKEYFQFFYYDSNTNLVAGCPEYRKLDSYFTKINTNQRVKLKRIDLTKIHDVNGMNEADLLQFFDIVDL